MPDSPFDRAVRIVEQIKADLSYVPDHLIGQWEGLIAAEIWEAQQNPSASIGRGKSSE